MSDITSPLATLVDLNIIRSLFKWFGVALTILCFGFTFHMVMAYKFWRIKNGLAKWLQCWIPINVLLSQLLCSFTYNLLNKMVLYDKIGRIVSVCSYLLALAFTTHTALERYHALQRVLVSSWMHLVISIVQLGTWVLWLGSSLWYCVAVILDSHVTWALYTTSGYVVLNALLHHYLHFQIIYQTLRLNLNDNVPRTLSQNSLAALFARKKSMTTSISSSNNFSNQTHQNSSHMGATAPSDPQLTPTMTYNQRTLKRRKLRNVLYLYMAILLFIDVCSFITYVVAQVYLGTLRQDDQDVVVYVGLSLVGLHIVFCLHLFEKYKYGMMAGEKKRNNKASIVTELSTVPPLGPTHAMYYAVPEYSSNEQSRDR